jgi:hypothetical protein
VARLSGSRQLESMSRTGVGPKPMRHDLEIQLLDLALKKNAYFIVPGAGEQCQ